MTQPRDSRTKIVATLGPASDSDEQIRELIEQGVDVFRINTAHGSRDQHAASLARVRAASDELNRPVGVLVDLAGPKIRLGQLVNDPTDCALDQEFAFVRGETSTAPDQFTCTYPQLVDELSVGDRVMLADGTVGMTVIGKEPDSVRCRVTAAGILRSRQGINLPGVALSVPAMTERDIDNARWAAGSGADFISLSFVRTPAEIKQLQQLVSESGSTALVIAKIEKGEALDCLDDIVMAADGIMVARGDLGVEIDLAETPVAQKRIINACQRFAKPVIVATQMLDSMQCSPRPTRAEVSDVANAILDGADACMLSGETAIGDFPCESVSVMRRVMQATERTLVESTSESQPIAALTGVHPITAATVFGASQVAEHLSARLFVIVSHSGATARVKAKVRGLTPVVGISDSPETLRKMSLFWGVVPLLGPAPSDGAAMRAEIERWGVETGRLAAGDRVVYLTGSKLMQNAHNTVVVQEVE